MRRVLLGLLLALPIVAMLAAVALMDIYGNGVRP